MFNLRRPQVGETQKGRLNIYADGHNIIVAMQTIIYTLATFGDDILGLHEWAITL